MRTFYIHTMGCKSNQFEGAVIAENLENNGLTRVEKIEEADLYVLNSCSVTHKSDNEALYLLRAAKNKNPDMTTVLTGCAAQIEGEALLKYADYIIGNDEKLRLYENLFGDSVRVSDVLAQNQFSEITLNDISKTRASLKVQDGCDNRCSYCIIWKARGKSRSASLEFIVSEINKFASAGFKEVIITGIHIGQWGKDLNRPFIDLVKAVENTDIARYRLGSLNPAEINDELLTLLSRSKKFCPHFHLSLQSACENTLRSMNRFYKVSDYMEQINRINEMFERPFIGSDIIAGFAGESAEDFETTRKNLENSGLTAIHTFPYSIRKGTIGASMPEQVEDKEKERRAEIIKEISRRKYNEFINRNIGTVQEVLIEKHRDRQTGCLKGITRNYLTVQIRSEREDLYNTLQQAKIVSYKNGIIHAELIEA